MNTTFQLVSDLHLDFRTKHNPYYNLPEWKLLLQRKVIQPNKESETPAEILIIAGDLAEMKHQCWLESLSILSDCYEFVVLVLGNHEYYNYPLASIKEKLQQLPGNCYHLECSELNVGGVTIAGATLWFQYGPEYRDLRKKISDFTCIEDLVDWVDQKNQDAVQFFSQSNADIFISHHLPSNRSIDPKYKNDQLNCFFVSDQTPIIESQQPLYWLHGHTHSAMDYMIGNTRVLCNPMGYPNERRISYPLCQFNIHKELEFDQ